MTISTTPSSAMYQKLKDWGISNRVAAGILLNTQLTFDGRMLRERIDESSQLSRRIVHTSPGQIPAELFKSFTSSCPQLRQQIERHLGRNRRRMSAPTLNLELRRLLLEEGSPSMAQALENCGIDTSPYLNMTSYIEQADVHDESQRTLLHLMLFVITGCLGNPQKASRMVVDYATEVLDADFHTAHTITSTYPYQSAAPVTLRLGLVRVVNDSIRAGSSIYALDPAGTTIGLLSLSDGDITDVDVDVSRQHARIWHENERWLLQDLGSTNGTRLVSGTDGSETLVEAAPQPPVEITATDIICLGAATRFLVMPLI